jgi:hypothetical protein
MPGPIQRRRLLLSSTAAPLNPITLFSNGETGYVFDPSTISSLSKDAAGTTPVTAAADSVGLGLSTERDMALGSQILNMDGTFIFGTGITKTADENEFVFNSVANNLNVRQDVGGLIVANNLYLVEFNISGRSGGGVSPILGGAFGTTLSADGIYQNYIVTSGANSFITAAAVGTTTLTLSDWVVRNVSAIPARQATAGAQPKYQTGPIRIVGDGIDDDLLTTFNPTLEGTIWFAGMIENASDVLMGSQPASEGRCFIGTNAAGELCGAVGEQGFSVITGGSDIRNAYDVFWLRYDGTTVKLNRGTELIYEAAQVGAVNTTIPDRLLSLNNNGTGASFAKAAFVGAGRISRSITDAELAGVTAYYDL